jgi:hypothetical protein
LRDGIKSQESHGEGNVKAKVNQPKTNLPKTSEVLIAKVKQVKQGEGPNLPKKN